MNRVRIRTINPEALKETLASLPGGSHVVLTETWIDGVVEVDTTNPEFLKFAVEEQGYGEWVGVS